MVSSAVAAVRSSSALQPAVSDGIGDTPGTFLRAWYHSLIALDQSANAFPHVSGLKARRGCVPEQLTNTWSCAATHPFTSGLARPNFPIIVLSVLAAVRNVLALQLG